MRQSYRPSFKSRFIWAGVLVIAVGCVVLMGAFVVAVMQAVGTP